MTLLDTGTWSGQLFSGGWREGGGGDAAVTEPATGKELARIGMASTADVTTAASIAAGAQRAWAATSFEERAAVLRRAGQLIESHAAEIEDWIIREAGSVTPKAQLETHVAAQECFEASALPSRAYGQLIPSAQPRMSMARRVPAGVVAVIAPFNVPLILSIRSVAPALALGNAVVLKPDPRTAVCGGVVLARLFEEAGLPDGLLHVLPGGADIGAALIEDPHVRVISFTGSTAAGRRVGEAAGRLLKRAHLELGGNSALVILDDVDVERAASAGAFGSFLHQGQICMTTGRHLVHENVADDYLELLTAKAANLPVGDPAGGQVALGPIIDEGQRDKIHDLVTSSVAQGATLATGGTYDGLFYRPTVLTGVTASTPAWANEIFGPVAPVARFSSLDEVAAMAADTPLPVLSRRLTRTRPDGAYGRCVASRRPKPTRTVPVTRSTIWVARRERSSVQRGLR